MDGLNPSKADRKKLEKINIHLHGKFRGGCRGGDGTGLLGRTRHLGPTKYCCLKTLLCICLGFQECIASQVVENSAPTLFPAK